MLFAFDNLWTWRNAKKGCNSNSISCNASFKVYLIIDIDVAAQRAFNDLDRKDTEKFDTVEEQKADMIKRYEMENDRYFKLYGIHKEDKNNYDLVIDTSYKTPEEIANEILTKYKEWQEN